GGTSMESARLLAAAVFAGTTGVVYAIARWSWGRGGALGVTAAFLGYRVWAYPHWQMVSYSTLAVGLLPLAPWVLGYSLAGRPGRIVLAGVASGLAILVKQDSGATGAAALGLACLVCVPGSFDRRARALTTLVVGATLVLAGATAVVTWQGILPALVGDTI